VTGPGSRLPARCHADYAGGPRPMPHPASACSSAPLPLPSLAPLPAGPPLALPPPLAAVPSAALVVGLDGSLSALVPALLRAAGWAVRAAQTAVPFAEAFAEGGFDLAVVALDTPWALGAELLRALRRRDPALPVVLIGDPARPGAVRAALEGGAVDLLPPTVQGLAALLELALERADSPAEERAGPPAEEGDSCARCPELEEELERAREHQQQARIERRDLERYAAEAAHDLHDPLRTLRLLVERLEDRLNRAGDPQGGAIAAQASQAVTRLQELVDGALADARGGEAPGPQRTADADQVFDEVVSMLAGSIQETGASVTRGPLAEVAVPPHQLRQILQNLVSNALRYGGSPPRVHVTARREGERWLLSVRDNGPGIPENQRQELFRPHGRLRSGGLSRGHGLGLSIVRKVTERVGGSIRVEDAPDEGSVFLVSLPVDPALEDDPTVLGRVPEGAQGAARGRDA